MANRFHHLFQLRFVDSGFLERCLEKDSEEAQQECFSWLGVSVMEKEVRSGSDSSIPRGVSICHFNTWYWHLCPRSGNLNTLPFISLTWWVLLRYIICNSYFFNSKLVSRWQHRLGRCHFSVEWLLFVSAQSTEIILANNRIILLIGSVKMFLLKVLIF